MKTVTVGIALLVLAGPAKATDLDMDTWTKTFGMVGFSAGQYAACIGRDQTAMIDDLAEQLVTAKSSAVADVDILLGDAGRVAYFSAMAAPCDTSRLDVIRADIATWKQTEANGRKGDCGGLTKMLRIVKQNQIPCRDTVRNPVTVIEDIREITGPRFLSGEGGSIPAPPDYHLPDKTSLEVLGEHAFKADDSRIFTRL